MLGAEAEGAGGRIGVADTLQEGLIRVLAEWPELQHSRDPARDGRLYRCMMDAACDALRAEHGRSDGTHARPLMIAFDFDHLEDSGDELPLYERELIASVLGATVRDISATGGDGRERRIMLTRAILLAGLRALSEREALIMIAVDDLHWDQDELAERLGIKTNALRQTLFGARKIFQGVLRHAIGLDLDEEERGRLHAYQAGELRGAENRHARRHLQHCDACKTYVREQHAFCENARTVLAPLPFFFGAKLLTRPATKKTAAASTGLLSQAGSTKALASVVALLGIGFGTTAVLAGRHPVKLVLHHDTGQLSVGTTVGATHPNSVPTAPAATKPARKAPAAKKHARTKRPAPTHARSTPVVQPQTAPTAVTATPPTTTAPPAAATGTSTPKKSSGGGEFFGQ
ncbi:hypothetical protein NBH00_21640 [Paraconexibacter antarcticus]|uniref:Sigma-70 family RNA polymerase sigma factor n=1 Tax=Paraconexibacter antarcticus TaxID=2949664 RepID=A0ABY5DPH1_9ACTN|nr:hypothetical protein [Paraconexibacter antarcticus]UTI63933.1 hypothetical protein NBH00_21640 [Paraconexibacter antarcticus]